MLCVVTVSCQTSPTQLYPNQLESFVSDGNNGFIQTKDLGSFSLELKYIPSALSAYRQIDASDVEKSDQAKFDSLTRTFENSLSFLLKLEHESLSFDELLVKEDLLGYVSGAIRSDFVLQAEGRDVPCVLHHFERSHGVSKSGVFNLFFELDEPVDEVTFLFNDTHFRLGPVRLRVPIEKLNHSIKVLPL